MSRFTKEMVEEYADKLLIGLTDNEAKSVLDEYEIIDSSIDLINNIPNINEIEPMTHCLDDFIYELGEDIIEDSCSIENILANSDQVIEREIAVPKVVG